MLQENIVQASEYLLKAEKEYSVTNPNYSAVVSAYVKLALVTMASETTNENTELSVIHKVRDYINQTDLSNLSNNEIAEKFHYHPHYISKLMKEEIGFTLHQYIIYTKISNAKKLLISTDFSIDDIAWKTGFSSTSYFIKIFHREIGKTPRQYREGKQKIYF